MIYRKTRAVAQYIDINYFLTLYIVYSKNNDIT